MASPPTKTKICGLSDADTLETAITAGADFLGFVFYEPSPRHISYRHAEELNEIVSGRALKVALTVNADDERLDDIVKALSPDYIQLHGDETVERVREIKARFGRPVIKAIKIRDAADLDLVNTYRDVCDLMLFDAKMPDDDPAALPGGNGVSFDWSLLQNRSQGLSFMLSGGLDAGNVSRAIETLHPAIVDVSSGVESEPGKKDKSKIRAFLEAVNAANKQDDAA